MLAAFLPASLKCSELFLKKVVTSFLPWRLLKICFPAEQMVRQTKTYKQHLERQSLAGMSEKMSSSSEFSNGQSSFQKAVRSPNPTQLSQSVLDVEDNAKAGQVTSYLPWRLLKISFPAEQVVRQTKTYKQHLERKRLAGMSVKTSGSNEFSGGQSSIQKTVRSPNPTQLSQSAVLHVEDNAKASQVSYLPWQQLKERFLAEKVSQPKTSKAVSRIWASNDPRSIPQKKQGKRKSPSGELDEASGVSKCKRAMEKNISDVTLLKTDPSTGNKTNTNNRAVAPRPLEFKKNRISVWGCSRQCQPQTTSPARHLSAPLAKYLASTITPRANDIQQMGATADLMNFLNTPDEKLSLQLWDLGEDAGDQRYKAHWQFSTQHGHMLMNGTWLQNDENW